MPGPGQRGTGETQGPVGETHERGRQYRVSDCTGVMDSGQQDPGRGSVHMAEAGAHG